MSKTKWTPGPWAWVEQEGDYHDLIAANGVRVHSDGSACGEYGPDVDVAGPDGRLIAAAPDLYEAAIKALAEMRDTVAPRSSFTDAVDALDAAITKAKGENHD